MEELLDVYARPPDPRRPLVCFDEGAAAIQAEMRPPLPMAPGRPARHDFEYAHGGSAALLRWCAPHLGRRGVTVAAQRTHREWAEAIRGLVDDQFPDAERIVLVMDNLNTHVAASLYKVFPAAEARRLWTKLEVHYTPRHGSWLNVAEVELSVLGRQGLDRRFDDRTALAEAVAAWGVHRNAETVTVNWHFTTSDARTKRKHLYPVLQPDN